MRDTKLSLGKRHIEVIRENNGHQYVNAIPRNITKVKNGNNGFERFYATIDGKRVEVFPNPNGKTGAAFRQEKMQNEKRDNGDCPNCADQASIAAPGQTVLCETHGNEKHYREMKEFFIEESKRLIFKPALPFCSCCGTEKTVVYVGIIISVSGHPLTFSFCVDCRDELTLKQNAARAAQERIGA